MPSAGSALFCARSGNLSPGFPEALALDIANGGQQSIASEGMMATSEAMEQQRKQAAPAARENSPVAYGLGSFGLESTYKVFWGFYIFFYVDGLGLAVALAAVINVIYAIWDAVNDPLVGYLSDNTRTRWGRRRPWLLTGLPFYVAFLVLTYAVPGVFRRGQSLFLYAMAIILLFETAYTVMSVNYNALFPELFQGFQARTRASAYYQGFCMAGELVGFALPPLIYAEFGFAPMAVSFAAVASVSLLIGIVRNTEDPRAREVPPLDLKAAFGPVLRDRHFWMFAMALTFLTFTTGIYTLATPFWAKYTLATSPQAPSLVFATVFIVAILAVSQWSRMLRRWGVKRTWLWAVAVMFCSAIVFGLASNLAVGLIGAAIVGAGLGGVKVCREMIMANLVDRSLTRTGHRREGLYYSLLRVFGKLSKLLEALALVLLAVLFGYVSGDDPGPQPDNAFRFLMSAIPFLFMALSWLLSLKLPFEGVGMARGEGSAGDEQVG
jgi:GPH family glycoside/pentoside/hexuronide:cation symporter